MYIDYRSSKYSQRLQKFNLKYPQWLQKFKIYTKATEVQNIHKGYRSSKYTQRLQKFKIYTKVTEVDLSAFVYRLAHKDFSPIVGTNIESRRK